MDMKPFLDIIATLEQRRAQIDEAIASIRRVMPLFEKDEPKQPYKDARVVESPKAPVRVAYTKPATPSTESLETSRDNGRLVAWRKQHGLSQTDAGKLFGCSTSMVCRIEQGTRGLTHLYREAMDRYDKEHPAKAQEPQRQPGPTFRPVP